VLFSHAYGLADRPHAIPNSIQTQFGIASGGKGFTALALGSLIAEGRLGLATTARSVLGHDLPLIDSRVTVEHLLAHRSGIGDYVDEEAGRDVIESQPRALPRFREQLDNLKYRLGAKETTQKSNPAIKRFA
jgi:CubicO group peptidase (beta-lactamase class C family)